MISPFAILAALRGGISTLLGVWRALPLSIRVALGLAAALGLGFFLGGRAADKRCEARISASIEAAKKFDENAARDALARAAQQAQAADARAEADKREIKAYADDVAKRVADGCRLGDDADRLNDGLGVSGGEIPAARPQPPAGRGDRAQPGHVRSRKGDR